MSATSIGLVLVRPLLKSAATTAAKLKLRAGRAALHRALAPLRNYQPGSLRQALRGAFGQSQPALAVERVVDPRAFRRGVGPGGRFYPSSRSYTTTTTRAPSGSTSALARSARLRPRGLGPSLVSHTGIPVSPARAFSSGPSPGAMRELGVNVPIGFRALADALRGEDERRAAIKRGRGGRVIRRVKQSRRAGIEGGRWKGVAMGHAFARSGSGASAAGKTRQSLVDALDELFPTTCAASAAPATDTHLIIPLASSLTPLFAPQLPTTRLFSADPPKQPGLLTGAWDGVDPAHAQRVAALLEELVVARLLDPGAVVGAGVGSHAGPSSRSGGPGSSLEVIYRRTGWDGTVPDALRVVLVGKTAQEVRARLRGSADLAACHLYEVQRAPSPSSRTSSVDLFSLGSVASLATLDSAPSYLGDAAVERDQWRMPVLDFSAASSPSLSASAYGAQDAGYADGSDVWAAHVPEPPQERSYGYASSLADSLELELDMGSAAGSGWSTPVYSDHSASEVSVDGSL